MSRIITDMTCTHCGERWNGYISFGHPENDFTYKWTCEACGGKNSELVKAWIDLSDGEACNDELIYEDDSTSIARIFTCDMQLIPLKEFTWKQFDDEQTAECLGGYLTLDDISDQLIQKSSSAHIGVIYVWVESPLSGVIYQYGNYSDDIWRRHGKTNGYA